MAIDPSIPLSVKNPNFDSAGLVNMLQQGQQRQQQTQLHQQQMQLNQQRITAGELSARQAQRAEQDAQAWQQIGVESGGDMDKAEALGRARGVSLASMREFQKHKGELLKQSLENQEKGSKLLTERNERLQGLITDAKSLQTSDPEGYAKTAPQIHAALAEIDPESAKHFDPTVPLTPEQLNALGFHVTSQKWAESKTKFAMDAAEEARKTEEEKRKAALFPSQQGKLEGEVSAQWRQVDASRLAAAKQQSPEAFTKTLREIAKNPTRFEPFKAITGSTKPEDILKIGTTPHEQLQASQAKENAANVKRHELSMEDSAKVRNAIAAGRLAQEQTINGMKYGPDTQEFWVKQLQENPDSVKEMPAEFRSAVGKKFRESTGLPLPTALNSTTQAQETAARNAMDGISFIRTALQNPEIQKQIGPIMGRLGNLEQRIGGATGLSPEAEQLAQELRTRMRYFVFQEGKAVLGGRLPQQLMSKLEENSASVKMEPSMLLGALKGAEDNANSVLDNADKQRFGGGMRPRSMRNRAAPATGGGKITVTAPDGSLHPFDTQAQADAFKKLAGIR